MSGGLLRCQARRIWAVGLVLVLYLLTSIPGVDPDERRAIATHFRFTPLELVQPPVARQKRLRGVRPDLERIVAWVSSVGAAVALTDADGDGLPNDLCLVDPRTDLVTVAPVPGTGDRFEPLTLDPAPLPYDAATMAPMGCLPGDLDEDGRTDLLVYYWGRTPIAFLRRGAGYAPREVVPEGGDWYSNAAALADLDGDGRLDLIVGNYFPDGARVLDAGTAATGRMQDSMSRSFGGGRNRLLLRCAGEAKFMDASAALAEELGSGWTLAVAAADLDGDLLPELYFANDFGPDRLLHNRSSPGRLELAPLEGEETFWTPRSSVLGRDSFKGMGVDFGDVDGDGLLDVYVSNIAEEFALLESHFCFVSTGQTALMREGIAPYVNRSEELGLARGGWAWEARLADFDNDGVLEAVQAAGFLRGDVNRWPELQELAMGNDGLLSRPGSWPRLRAGDDISGRNGLSFFVRSSNGKFVNLAREVGVGGPHVGRGIAVADVDGDGDLDFAVANQWEPSRFYRNDLQTKAGFLGLHLLLPLARGTALAVRAGHPGPDTAGRPAVGAAAAVHRPDGRVLVAQVDGGNGHSGKRSPDLHFGLGDATTAVRVELSFRDPDGRVQRETLEFRPGWHTVVLPWRAARDSGPTNGGTTNSGAANGSGR